MGSVNYLIIPSMKIKIPTKLSKDGYGMPDIEQWDKLFQNNDFENFYIEDNTKIDDLKTISKMYLLTEIALNVSNPMYFETILVYYLTKKEIDYCILSEYDEKGLEKYKDFILIE